MNALASDKLNNILNQAENITPTVWKQLRNAQRALYASQQKTQSGGFGPIAAMASQMAMLLLGQLINKI